jgi:hypothetical protein
MDAIEQRLTTDITGAQAVVDLGQVVRHVALDRGRPVNLVRIGMVVDAFSRYLVDGGAMLYGVVERSLLSEPELTSKERMVLSRWADTGVIEVTKVVDDRVAEVAGMTGLPLIALRPMPDLVARHRWLADGGGRVLRLVHRDGVAMLRPMDDPAAKPAGAEPSGGPASSAAVTVAIGRAKVVEREVPAPAHPPAEPQAEAPAEPQAEAPAEAPVAARDPETGAETGAASKADSAAEAPPDAAGLPAGPAGEPAAGVAAEPPAAEPAATESAAAEPAVAEPGVAEPAVAEPASGESASGESAGSESAAGGGQQQPAELPPPVEFFGSRGAAAAVTRISWHRFRRTEPDPAHLGLLQRQWRCNGFDCPAFGEDRRIGQPVPRLRGGKPVCPKHDEPVIDIGPRPAAYPVSVVVDDLPRRRLVVLAGRTVSIGLAVDDAERGVVSVAPWLHSAALARISHQHVRLVADDNGLTVTDLSQNGTMVWQRKSPDDPGCTMPLYGDSYLLGEWDSIELYTGVELMRGDRRLAAMLGRDEPASVLLDAPTAAYHQVAAD